MIIRVAGIALLSALSFVLLKKDRAEFAFAIELCMTAGLLLLLLPYIETIISYFSELSDNVHLQFDFGIIMTKCAGIAVITKMISELCKDAGENALSVKVELAAKVLILVQAMPIIKALGELMIALAENIL